MLAHLCSQRRIKGTDAAVWTGKHHHKTPKNAANTSTSKSPPNPDTPTKPPKLKPKHLIHQMKKLALKATDAKTSTPQQQQQQQPNHLENCQQFQNLHQQLIDFDHYLNNSSLEEPANIPMVITQDVVLRATGIFSKDLVLAMGNVVNGVHKTDEWLFIQTAQGSEGYVPYTACLPLGINPPGRKVSKIPAAWEISPKRSINVMDCNKTDTQKLFHFSDTVLAEKKSEKTIVVCDYWSKNENQVSVQRNETVTVIERSFGDWLRVQTVDGREGMIPTAYTTLGEQYFV